MPVSIRRSPLTHLARRLALVGLIGFVVGYGAEAFAIDRKPFEGGFVSDARPGYGAERPRTGSERRGYGAERPYSGAENWHSTLNGRHSDGGSRYRSHGSFLVFDDVDGDFDADGYGEELVDGSEDVLDFDGARSGIFPGFGATAGGSFLYFGDGEPEEGDVFSGVAAATDARVIDVAQERLDRQPIGARGVAVSYVGTTKIIRIAASGSAQAAPVSDPEIQRDQGKPALEPWSEAWQRYCARAHPGFDPARGTFSGADGSMRFCTGE